MPIFFWSMSQKAITFSLFSGVSMLKNLRPSLPAKQDKGKDKGKG